MQATSSRQKLGDIKIESLSYFIFERGRVRAYIISNPIDVEDFKTAYKHLEMRLDRDVWKWQAETKEQTEGSLHEVYGYAIGRRNTTENAQVVLANVGESKATCESA